MFVGVIFRIVQEDKINRQAGVGSAQDGYNVACLDPCQENIDEPCDSPLIGMGIIDTCQGGHPRELRGRTDPCVSGEGEVN